MIYILFFVLCIFYSCNSQNNSIIFSTKKAKSNRNESEKNHKTL
ncbi:unknown [Parabacteroides sp. CAG:2]|nr:unknown [Parabacteroides sp. CAG:2]